MKNVLCLKWGKRYGAECVNRPYRGVKANLSGPFRFVCVTDDPTGLVGGVEAIAGYRGRHLNTWTRPAPWVRDLMERYG